MYIVQCTLYMIVATNVVHTCTIKLSMDYGICNSADGTKLCNLKILATRLDESCTHHFQLGLAKVFKV